ncbi:hypothetical protein FO519_006539 [Halicephalobus sp. NKZ332]|nr:hypothetical protein FO519_006539 [Halicephalobus sp. NKZ332]
MIKDTKTEKDINSKASMGYILLGYKSVEDIYKNNFELNWKTWSAVNLLCSTLPIPSTFCKMGFYKEVSNTCEFRFLLLIQVKDLMIHLNPALNFLNNIKSQVGAYLGVYGEIDFKLDSEVLAVMGESIESIASNGFGLSLIIQKPPKRQIRRKKFIEKNKVPTSTDCSSGSFSTPNKFDKKNSKNQLPSYINFAVYKSSNGPLECCSFTTLRVFISTILFVDVAILLGYGIYGNYNGTDSDGSYILGNGILLLAIGLVFGLTAASRNKGLVTSGVLFNFWLLLAVCGFPEFRYKLSSYINMGEEDEESFDFPRFYLFMVYYPLVLVQLLTSCFSDTPKYNIMDKKTCPELFASFLNQITFNWFTGMAIKGHRRALESEDLWDLNERDTSKHLLEKFQKNWDDHLLKSDISRNKPRSWFENPENSNLSRIIQGRRIYIKSPPTLSAPLFKTFKWPFLAGTLYKLIFDLMQFISPQLLKHLINFVEDRTQPMWVGVGLSIIMFTVALVQSMILHQYFHNMFRLGMNIRSVLTSVVYRKALFLSNKARKNRTVGEIVNLMSVDIQRVQDLTSFINLFWSAPLQVILSVYFLLRLLGVAVIGGLAVLIIMAPLNYLISIKMRNCQIQQMKYKDERLKMTSEALNGMKVLKLYAWEESMKKMILEIRQKEVGILRKLAYLNAATALSWSCAPFLVAVVTFGTYVTIDPENNVLTPQITFVALSLFNILRFPLAILAMIMNQAVQSHVSNKRLKSFLAEDEIENLPLPDGIKSDTAICIKKGNFQWDEGEEFKLQNINLISSSGEFSEILEEFLIEEAKNRARSISFGEDADEVKEVLAELERLDPMKKKEIQRQISASLERLSPVQSPESVGSPRKSEGGRKSIDEHEKIPLLNENQGNGTLKKPENPSQINEKSKLIEKEGMETGKVKFNVYWSYLKAIGLNVTVFFFIIYIISSILGVYSNLYLADWSDHAAEIQRGENGSSGSRVRIGVYTALGIGQVLFVCIASILMALGMVIASKILHEKMLTNILRSPMSFFDVTPLGRILNRFGKDIYVTDTTLPASLINMISMVIQAIFIISVPIIVTPWILVPLGPILYGYFLLLDIEGLDTAIPRSLLAFVRTAIASVEILSVIAYATPIFLAPACLLAIIYFFVLRFYVSTSRQLKRLESTTRSPIYSHFQESIQGATSIRAYRCTEFFLLESQKRVDNNLVSYYPSIVANRWLAVRLELVGNMIVLLSALLGVLWRDSPGVTAGLIGLSVAYAFNITQTLNWAVRMTGELETNVVAIERIKEYSETPTEAALETGFKLPKNWPTRGSVNFEDLKVRYRPELDLILKGISAHLIQRTIKEQFADCTVLTIAHRLHSVIDSDRLMVLDSGKITEFQEPQTLLKNPDSVFYSMAIDAGLVSG